MQRCAHCDGFIPAQVSSCPNCSRVAPWRGVLEAVGAGVAAITLMACYGAPPVTQSTDCQDYINCFEKTGGTKDSLESAYGPMGSCWSTTQTAADKCTSSCKAANDDYKSNGIGADAGCTFK